MPRARRGPRGRRGLLRRWARGNVAHGGAAVGARRSGSASVDSVRSAGDPSAARRRGEARWVSAACGCASLPRMAPRLGFGAQLAYQLYKQSAPVHGGTRFESRVVPSAHTGVTSFGAQLSPASTDLRAAFSRASDSVPSRSRERSATRYDSLSSFGRCSLLSPSPPRTLHGALRLGYIPHDYKKFATKRSAIPQHASFSNQACHTCGPSDALSRQASRRAASSD